MSNHRLTVVRVGPITLFFYALVMLPFWMIKYSIIALVLFYTGVFYLLRAIAIESKKAWQGDLGEAVRRRWRRRQANKRAGQYDSQQVRHF
jgi:hypothetical protein